MDTLHRTYTLAVKGIQWLQLLLLQTQIIKPISQDVSEIHKPGGYLDKFAEGEAQFTK